MDAKYYCDHMQSELTGLKARAYNDIADVDNMDDGKKAELSSEVSALHALVADLSGKIDSLKNQCPADWSAESQISTSSGKHSSSRSTGGTRSTSRAATWVADQGPHGIGEGDAPLHFFPGSGEKTNAHLVSY